MVDCDLSIKVLHNGSVYSKLQTMCAYYTSLWHIERCLTHHRYYSLHLAIIFFILYGSWRVTASPEVGLSVGVTGPQISLTLKAEWLVYVPQGLKFHRFDVICKSMFLCFLMVVGRNSDYFLVKHYFILF
jgi:hypothetical protein